MPAYLMRSLAVLALASALTSGCAEGAGGDVPGDAVQGDAAPDIVIDTNAGDANVGDATDTTAADAGDTTAPDGAAPPPDHAANIATLVGLLPADARGVLAVDVAALLSGSAADEVVALFDDGDDGAGAGDPALAEPLAAIRALAGEVDLSAVVASALLVQTTDAAEGLFLLARVRGETMEDVAPTADLTPDGTHGAAPHELFRDGAGHQLALLPGGVLVVGDPTAVSSVLDVADGVSPGGASAIAPFLAALDGAAPFAFVYGLPALFDASIAPDRSLRGAALVSGSLAFADGAVAGSVSFHTPNAAAFVAAYNELDRHATEGEAPLEEPLVVGEPVAADLGRVVVTISSTPIERSPDDLVASRNTLKKLVHGMAAYDYAEDVDDPGNAAWVDLVVKSEADGDTPPSPGSVFVRWEFRDQAAIDAFEANELPAGFSLAPCRFLESDDPAGEYFLALNLYNAGGGSIVSGARAEWDVFVHPPEGADPDAGTRPRFFVVDALAEAISADPVNLMTPAEPLSHDLVDGRVVTTVRRFEGDDEVPVFEVSFPKPDPAQAPVARFTREMAIGNDYIYWGHGVYDRALYNATTYNHDAYFADVAQVELRDDSRWASYLKPTVKDVVYYVNTLEYVASPMANLRSEYLDITPEWREELLAFKTNGHQRAMMRKAVELLFRGAADALTGFRVENTTPAAYYSFAVTDPEGLAAALGLPAGYRLARTPILDGSEADHFLTLAVTEIADAVEGTRAEWGVYADDGSGRARFLVVHLQTEDAAADPVRLLNLPSEVRHEQDGEVLRTRLGSSRVAFAASFPMAGATDEALALDWIEAGDHVCRRNGICDQRFYDAETLDVPVHRPTEVTIETIETPWDAFIDTTPSVVFYRDNPQQYAVKPWHNLKVFVPELPFGGLADRTHAIDGTGSMIGRTTDLVDSSYTYTGDGVLDGDQLRFAIDQEIDNLLGVAHIITTGSFDLATGIGTQTVVDCLGPALMCSGVVKGSSTYYAAQDLDASDRDAITWAVNVVVDLGGSFGLADSASTFAATAVD